MSLFGSGYKQTPTTLYNGLRTNQAILGTTLPVLIGQQRLSWMLLWYGDFTSAKAQGASKKAGGASSYVYSAAVVGALCMGPCQGFLGVWDSTGRYAVDSNSEVTTAGSSPYTPVNYPQFAQDIGVSVASLYNVTANDYGSPGPATLSGTQQVPLVYTASNPPGPGQYTINSSGQYVFNSAQYGNAVTVSYASYRYIIQENELAIVPLNSPYQVTVQYQSQFNSDNGVGYYPGGPAMTAVGGTPTVAGTYSYNNGNYLFAAADAGQGISIFYSYKDTNTDANAPNMINLTFLNGARGQEPWSYLSSKHPGEDLGYSDIACVASSGIYMGSAPQLPQYNFEVVGPLAFGGGIVDASPADAIGAVLTSDVFGIGFPGAYIDPSLAGDSNNSSAKSYWAANSFFISQILQNQDSAMSVLGEWLEAGQCYISWDEGKLKFIPLGDTTAVANGYTYTPPTQPVIDLDDNDFVADKEDPVTIEQTPWQSRWNRIGIRWSVRENAYNEDTYPLQDDASVQQYGLQTEDPKDYQFITTYPAAQWAAAMRLQRLSAIYTKYSFTLKSNFAFLSPGDIVTITDGLLGTAGTMFGRTGVRITQMTDDPEKGITIEAEQFPWGVGTAILQNAQAQLPSSTLDAAYSAPDETEVLAVQVPAAASLQQSNMLYIFACGTGSNWGGCDLWYSYDNTTFSWLAKIEVPGRIGTLVTALPATADPDTTDTLTVQMASPDATLASVSESNADELETLSALIGTSGLELVSYANVSLTGLQTYSLSYLRRGQYGTPVKSFAIGSDFVRLDEASYQEQYAQMYVGKTIYLKATSFNSYGNTEQSIADVESLAVALTGTPGAFNLETGASNVNVFTGPWSNITPYLAGNECTYLGDYWLCVAENTNSPPSLTNTNWQLVGSGSQFMGAWDSSTDYAVGEEVTYNGDLYIAIADNSNAEPDTHASDWQQLGGGLSFSGAWAPSTAYAIGVMVSYSSSIWLCLVANTNSAPAIGNTNWQLIGSQSEFLGVWVSGTSTYLPGQEVSYSGLVYICLVAVSGTTPPPSDAAHWQPLGGLSYVGVWASGSTYSAGQIISYSGNTYLCLTGNSSTTTPNLNTADWLLIGPANASALAGSQTFLGAWSSSTPYFPGNEVSYASNLYLCVTANTNTPPPGSAKWELMGGWPYMGPWSNTCTYLPGQEVGYLGNIYKCLVSCTDIVPTSSTTDWAWLGGMTYAGSWSSTVTYQPGQEVLYSGGIYLCIQSNLNVPPPSNTSDWEYMGGMTFLGAWSSTVAYLVGQDIIYNGAIYRCLVANTNVIPSSNATDWAWLGGMSYAGQWSGSVPYLVGQVVGYSGNLYLCTVANTNVPPPSNTTDWQLMSATTFQGSWSNIQSYQVGQQVSYQSAVYLCLVSCTNVPPTSSTTDWQWLGGISFRGAWNSSIAYLPEQEVLYSGNLYICEVSNTNVPPPSNGTDWQLVATGQAYQGAWNSGTTYLIGQTVSYAGSIYVCLASNTNVIPNTNTNDWLWMGGMAYQGSWSSSATYSVGQEVSYGGFLYMCLIQNTGVSPTGSPTYWLLLGGVPYQGSWSSSATYVPGMEASYNGSLYLCLVQNTNTPPNTNATDWQPLGSLTFQGAWSNNIAYIPGQEVNYGGSIFLCLVANTNVTPPSNATDWMPLGGLWWRGAWSSSVAYSPGSEVTYNGNTYLCLTACTNVAPNTNANDWQQIGNAAVTAWSSSLAYLPGQEVLYQGSTFVCLAGNTNVPPSTNTTDWQNETGVSYVGAWSNNIAYIPGQQVSYIDGNQYICTVANTNVIPPSNATDWLLVGPQSVSSMAGAQVFLGAWSNNIAYKAGNEVTYTDGNYYLCLLPNTNVPPPNSTADWQLVGPDSINSISGAEAFLGVWSQGENYDPGNQVAYLDGNFYLCLVSNGPAETAVEPPSFNYRGVWTSGTPYNPANLVVDISGNYWLCLVANTSTVAPVSSNPDWLEVAAPGTVPSPTAVSTIAYSPYWQLTGPAVAGATSGAQVYLGLWSAALDYDPGNIVSWPSGGSTWVCMNATALGNNTMPGQTTTNGIVYWTQIAPPTLPPVPVLPWNATTLYFPGNEVTYAPASSGAGNTGSLAPTVVTQVARQKPWANPSNAKGTSAYATCTLYGSNNTVNESYALQFTGFNYGGVPSSATITGISFSAKVAQTGGTSASMFDSIVLIGMTGNSASVAPAYPSGNFPSTPTAVVYGGTGGSLFGITPAALLAAMQAGTLGFQASCQCTLSPGTGAAIELNSVAMTVYYTTTGSGTSSPYKCLVENGPGSPAPPTGSGGNPEPPSASPAYWQLMSAASVDAISDGALYSRTLSAGVVSGIPYTLQGAYSASVAYAVGMEVTSNGSYYVCTAKTTAGIAPTNTSYWTVIGPVNSDAIPSGSTTGIPLQTQIPAASALVNGIPYTYRGAWAPPPAGTSYLVGQEVAYPSVTGNYFICTTANSDASWTPSHWQIEGPATLDVLADGSSYIRSAQYAGSAIVLDNPSFLAGTAGWSQASIYYPVTFSVSASSPITNGKSLQVTTSVPGGEIMHTRLFKASPGDVFYASVYLLSDGTFQAGMLLVFYDGAGNTLSPLYSPTNSTTSWAKETLTATAPANTSYVQFIPLSRNDSSGGSHSAWVSQPHLVRLASLDSEVADGLAYLRMPGANMDSNRRGIIDFSQPGHLYKVLDNINDGLVYARMPGANMDPNHRAIIDFSQSGHLGKILDNIGDGSTYLRMPGANMDPNHRAIIDFSQSGHLGKILDNIGDGTNYIRSAQFAGSAIVLDNPSFLAGTAGWIVRPGFAGTIAVSSLSPVTNGKSLGVTTSLYTGAALHLRQFKASPGDVFYASVYLLSDGTFNAGASIVYYDGAGNYLGESPTATTTSSSWVQKTVQGTAPANTAYLLFYPCVRYDSAGGSHLACVAQPHLVRLASLDNEVADGTTYVRPGYVNADHTYHVSTHLRGQGSIAGMGDCISAAITYASTSSSITWSWSAFNVYFADGGTIAVTASSQAAFTGLTASTTYYFGAYFNGSTIVVVMSDVSSGKGGESIQQQMQVLQGDGHILLSANMMGITTASGGQGGGGGGGGGTCPADDQPMETSTGIVPACEVVSGTLLKGADGRWKRVDRAYSVMGQLAWVHIGGEAYHVDMDHGWLRPGGSPASPAGSGDWISQRVLRAGDRVQGADGSLYTVEGISRPHPGKYREIALERQPDGDQSFQMGSTVAHNITTIIPN